MACGENPPGGDAGALMPCLVLVNGLPCSGKTTLARQIAKELNLPLFEKDSIKERLFDTLGWSDLEWSRKLSRASKQVLFYIIAEELKAGRSLIVECNFIAEIELSRSSGKSCRQSLARSSRCSAMHRERCWWNASDSAPAAVTQGTGMKDCCRRSKPT